jgi:hypothetical protein
MSDMQLNFALLGIIDALVKDKAELDQEIRTRITIEDLQDFSDDEHDEKVVGCCPCFEKFK